jgi:hypothetical protein
LKNIVRSHTVFECDHDKNNYLLNIIITTPAPAAMVTAIFLVLVKNLSYIAFGCGLLPSVSEVLSALTD